MKRLSLVTIYLGGVRERFEIEVKEKDEEEFCIGFQELLPLPNKTKMNLLAFNLNLID